jgi:hypothetical protein
MAVAISIGRVEKIDAKIGGPAESRERLAIVGDAVRGARDVAANPPGAKPDLGHRKATFLQFARTHGTAFFDTRRICAPA